jgi:hypothetical protein
MLVSRGHIYSENINLSLLGLPDSISIALILLPGFLLIWFHTRYSKQRIELDDISRTAVSILAGVILLPLSYLLLVLFSNAFSSERGISFTGPNTWEGFTDIYSPSEIFGAYLLTLVIAILIGTVTGSLFSQYMKEKYYRRRTRIKSWDFLLLNYIPDTVVQVKTTDNEEIWGTIKYAGGNEKDLILQYPRLVTSNESEKQFRKLGDLVYLRPDEVKELSLKSRLNISENITVLSFLSSYFYRIKKRLQSLRTGQPTQPEVIKTTYGKSYTPTTQNWIVQNRTDKRFGEVIISLSYETKNDEKVSVSKRVEELSSGQQWKVKINLSKDIDLSEDQRLKRNIRVRRKFPYIRKIPIVSRNISIVEVSDMKPVIEYRKQWADKGSLFIECTADSKHSTTTLAYIEMRWKAIDSDGVVIENTTVGISDLKSNEQRSFIVEFEGVDRQKVERVEGKLQTYWPVVKRRS